MNSSHIVFCQSCSFAAYIFIRSFSKSGTVSKSIMKDISIIFFSFFSFIFGIPAIIFAIFIIMESSSLCSLSLSYHHHCHCHFSHYWYDSCLIVLSYTSLIIYFFVLLFDCLLINTVVVYKMIACCLQPYLNLHFIFIMSFFTFYLLHSFAFILEFLIIIYFELMWFQVIKCLVYF